MYNTLTIGGSTDKRISEKGDISVKDKMMIPSNYVTVPKQN